MKQHLCTCIALIISASSLTCAQQEIQHVSLDTGTAAVSSAATDRAEGLIKLDVVVADATGKPVSGLGGADFSLLENDRSQNILSFQAFNGRGTLPEPPAKIILLIDTIELPGKLEREERLAVITYLRQGGGRLEHPVSVFMLADTGLWTVAPSRDGNVLAHEIEHSNFTLVHHDLGSRGGQIPPKLKAAPLESALKVLGQIAAGERKRPGRKLLLWIGPGWGIGSGASEDIAQGAPPLLGTVTWVSALLREAHLVLYSFTVGEAVPLSQLYNSQSQLYKGYLDGVISGHKASFMNLQRKVLAVQSGGRVMDNDPDLVHQIDSCVQDAGPFYRISFDPFPADHPNEYHNLKVIVNRPGLIARTNTGYYDQPYYSVDPIPPPRHVSVGQLEQLLSSSRGKSDADLAKQLSELVLTERLSEHRLSLLDTAAVGKRSRQELRILADSAAFQNPPADEIPTDAPPDLNTQRQILSVASAYLSTTIHKLPDLFARRATVRYQETPMYLEAETSVNYQPLHVTDTSATTVHYRNGSEIAETKQRERKANDAELITYGVFGPALYEALDFIDKNGGLTGSTGLIWTRWEQGVHGRVAVFRSSVPSDKSRRRVFFCCLADGDGTEAFQPYAGYHEEITIDPESGAILRLAYQADLKSTTPLARSDIMVEYGPVEIGERTYVCPLRSITITRGRSVQNRQERDEAFMTYGPYATMLNDISFDRYHIFGSESRVLTGVSAVEK